MAFPVGYSWMNLHDGKEKKSYQDRLLSDIDKEGVVTMGELLPTDLGILIACNYTADDDCSKQLASLEKGRGNKNLRFWPANYGPPSHATQGMMALGMIVCLLGTVIIYCCWGTCWKYFRAKYARGTSRRSLTNGRTNDGPCFPEQQPAPRRPRSHDRCRTQHGRAPRSNRGRSKFSEAPPPTYETLFGTDVELVPPSYSSLELNTLNETSPNDSYPRTSVAPYVTVEVERTNAESDKLCDSDSRTGTDHCQNAPSLREDGTHLSIVQVK